MIYRLTEDIAFPDPRNGEPEGLFAVGGDLSLERLLLAYANGIFPWYDFRRSQEIMWYCPMRRFVIFPSEIHISHSMRPLISKGTYRISFNNAFAQVIDACSTLRIDEEGAWLGGEVVKAYLEMHRNGLASSVEAWFGDRLAGGLYGVSTGRNFFGESMFSLRPNASKAALIVLALTMREQGGGLIDCQFETPHLKSMGGRYISYDEYLEIING